MFATTLDLLKRTRKYIFLCRNFALGTVVNRKIYLLAKKLWGATAALLVKNNKIDN